MSDQNIYDPEDLEQLLKTKSFQELLPEEKAFVLQFIDGDLEYDSLKSTYRLLGTLPEIEPVIEPKPDSKDKLLAAFAAGGDATKSKNQTRAKLIPIYKKPLFQMISAAAVVVFGVFFMFQSQEAGLAENKVGSPKQENTSIQKKEIKTEIEENLIDNKSEVISDEKNDLAEPLPSITTVNNSTVSESVIPELEEIEVLEEATDSDIQTFTFSDANVVVSDDYNDQSGNYSEANKDEKLTALLNQNEDASRKKETESIDTSLYELIETDALSDDYTRMTTGNAAMDYYQVETTSSDGLAIDAPTATFGLEVADEIPASTAANFTNLLNKLHTSK